MRLSKSKWVLALLVDSWLGVDTSVAVRRRSRAKEEREVPLRQPYPSDVLDLQLAPWFDLGT